MFSYRDMRSLDDAIAHAYAFLKKGGCSVQARDLLDEFYELDQVCFLAELRLLLAEHYPPEVVAQFDR